MSSNTIAGAAGPSSGTGPRAGVDLRAKSRPGERVITLVLQISVYASIAITFGIVAALIRPVLDFFAEVPFGDFFAFEGTYAVFPLVTATLMVTVIALLLAVPLGLGAALYLREYASRRALMILKPTVELLAVVPSVLYGLF